MKLLKTALALAIGTSVAVTAHADATTDKIKSTGTISVGYREASIPFSYLDDNAKPTGFAWELTEKIAEKVKQELGMSDLQINTVSITSANRIPLIKNGTIQIECGSTTNNTIRGKEADFTVNFFYTGTRFLVKTDSGIQSLTDLKGKILTSTLGTTPLQLLQKMNAEQKLGIKITTAKDHDAGFLNVQQGAADAFGMDEILLFGLRAAAPNPAEFSVVGEPLMVEPYSCLLPKNSPDFKAIADKAIIELMESGEFEKMYDKWFTQPLPPKGINLELPMSAELKANLKEHSDKPSY